MALHIALALSLFGSLLLAVFLLLRAGRVPGARLLVLFLLGVSVWIAGNELPPLLGPGTERVALAMLATAPLTSAVFVHFALSFTGTRTPAALLPTVYGLGGGAMLLALVIRPGSFGPFAGLPFVATPNTVGWIASLVWGGLAAAGTLVLLRAGLRERGLARRQALAVGLSSGWGAVCMAGYAAAALRLDVYPWPLLGLPLYPVILVYGVLRYRVLVANAWARRGLAWTLLGAVGAGVLAVVSSAPVLAELGPVAAGGAAALAFLALGGPVRWLAERVIYPGGLVSPADVAAWRAALAPAASGEKLARTASALLTARLRTQVEVLMPGMVPEDPGAPRLRLLQDGAGGWRTELEGWEAAPPGPRQAGTLFGTVVAEEAARLERAAALAARERERAERERLAELGAIAATVAHDIRNPLNIIAMAAAAAPGEARAEIREQIARITRLSADLLDYAKPWRVEPVPTDLGDLARSAARGAPNVEFGPRLEAPLPVRADPSRMTQALVNLVENARAVPGVRRVMIDAERGRGGALRLLVLDDGPGVPAELREELFRPFVSRTPGGTGLGLAIVAKAMEAHGGTAGLEERAGWSTCFVLTLPAQLVLPPRMESMG
ncbi:ATP-binding protein [Pararoseomonas sp. SCSIO 73927]|uniref:ATP-binding protein n=1 Tax=Pararoseomonas sp. SCSIO 73927 TaxID=3114537 RepID=UPI0030CC8FC6